MSAVFKVTVVGSASVGKTSVLSMLKRGKFSDTTSSTIGATYFAKQFETSNGEIELHVWDTAGQERFMSVVPMYLRGSHAVIVMCSVDIAESFNSIDHWLGIVKECCEDTFIYIVANKTDLGENEIYEKAKNFAAQHSYEFFGTSATDLTTILPLFEKISEDCAALPRDDTVVEVQIADVQEEKKKGCC